MSFHLRPLIQTNPSELVCLQPGNPLDGLVINAFLRVIERRSQFYPTLPRVWAVDTAFLPDWWRGQFGATRLRAAKADLFQKDLLLFPLHLPEIEPEGHWALVTVRLKEKLLRAYDSLGSPRMAELAAVQEFLCCAAMEEGNDAFADGWTLVKTSKSCPRQEDNVSCGVFACVFAEMAARNVRIHGVRIGATQGRKVIASALRRGRFDQEEFSEFAEESAKAALGMDSTEEIDLTSPDGEERMEIDMEENVDPLMEELNAAIEGTTASTLPVDVDEIQEPPSPCLSLDISDDLEDQAEHLDTAEPQIGDENGDKKDFNLPMECEGGDSAVQAETQPGEGADVEVEPQQTVTKPVGLEKPVPPSTGECPDLRQRIDTIRQRKAESSEVGHSAGVTRSITICHGAEVGDLPWIPARMKRRLAEDYWRLTPIQRKNKKWRVFYSDGTFIRLRPRQVERILHGEEGS